MSGDESSEARAPLIVAELLRAHGIKGEMMARVSGVDAEDLPSLSLRMERRHGEPVAVRIQGVRPGGGGWIVRVEGVADRSQAEELRGARLFARREDLPVPEAGEWWIADLVGLRVVGDAGEELGVLEEVLKLPANDVFVVRGAGGEILVPVLEGVVREIASGTMHIAVPPGLLDPPQPEAAEGE